MSARVCVSWVLVCAVLVSGCSTSATISMRDGTQHEVKICDSDKDYIYGCMGESFSDGSNLPRGYQRFERGDVEDIDHPGSGAMAIGGGLVVIGGVSATLLLLRPDPAASGVSAFPSGDEFVESVLQGVLAGFMITVALGGGGLIMVGADQWLTSRDAAERSTNLQVAPLVVPDGEGGVAPGVGLRLTW